MKIYFYEGFTGKSSESRSLLLDALSDYSGKEFKDEDIYIKASGKPYVKYDEIEFSVSHSKQLWMVAIGKNPVGADIQVFKKCNTESISKKLYSKNEIDYINLWGDFGFFKLWSRREALVKSQEKSVFEKMPKLVDNENELLDEIKISDKTYVIKDIEISDDIACSICTLEDEDFEIELMN
ncbi:MAG: hypothetical protein JJE03_04525 [Peptostreptococcaceae bacterium]|nr:hypothetical protein [Peptostreptococcaceae bacterium]